MENNESSHSQDHHQYEIHRIRAPYLQTAIIVMGVFMAILDTSVVNVAIPKMETELNASTAQIQWVLTAYMLTIGVLVPISGWMTDKFGPKKLFLSALVVFTGGSILCGMAWNLPSIVFFRIIQGMGGGFMMPVAMSMIFRIFPPDRRGTVMGVFGVAMIAAPAFGPVISGVLVEYWSWRWIFYLNVPIGIVAVGLGLFAMQEFSHEVKGTFDWAGFILSTVGFFSLLYGFNEVSSHGWGSAEVETYITLGVLLVVAFIIVELFVKHPMLNFRVTKNYMFSMSLLITSLINTATFAGVFLLPVYLQNIMGYSAIRTGLFMTPAALASAVLMPIGGRLFDRIGARPLAVIGLLIMTVATYLFSKLSLDSSSGTIQWLYILRSVGAGICMMPIMTAGMNTVRVNMVSQGTALTNTTRQVASSLGTALLTSYMATQAAKHTIRMSWQVTANSPQGHALLSMQQLLHAHGMTLAAAKQMAVVEFNQLITAQGFVAGLNDTYMLATFITLAAWVAVWFYASKAEREIRASNRNKNKKSKKQPALEAPKSTELSFE